VFLLNVLPLFWWWCFWDSACKCYTNNC